MIRSIDYNRVWIGYDKKVFEAVQTEAFRLGYSWIDGAAVGDTITTHQRLSKAKPEDVAWITFQPMELSIGKFKVMGYNTQISEADFDLDTRGNKITLEDMRALEPKSENKQQKD